MKLHWFVYIIRCSDNTLYTGITNDLTARIAKHNLGKGAAYTKPRLPVSLVYSEVVEDKSSALRREHAIKQLSRSQKLQLVSSAG